jgi:hypothetical protein
VYDTKMVNKIKEIANRIALDSTKLYCVNTTKRTGEFLKLLVVKVLIGSINTTLKNSISTALINAKIYTI